MAPPVYGKLWRTKELAQLFGVSPSTITRYLRRGYLPSGKRIRAEKRWHAQGPHGGWTVHADALADATLSDEKLALYYYNSKSP